MAVLSTIKVPTMTGISGLGLCNPEANIAPPTMYSANWCNQNERFPEAAIATG
jgi:hypothetical protein